MKTLLLLASAFLINKSLTSQTPNHTWVKQSSAQGNFYIGVDSQQNVYSCGTFSGTVDFDLGPNTFNLTSNGSYDIFISKQDANGNFLWAKQVGSSSMETVLTFKIDASGNSYIGGLFYNTLDFNPGTGTVNVTSNGSTDAFILKLDNSGNYTWVKTLGNSGSDGCGGIDIDLAGNVYAVCNTDGIVDADPGSNIYNVGQASRISLVLIKLSSSGNFLFANTKTLVSLGGGYQTSLDKCIKVDASGNTYLTGNFEGSLAVGTTTLITSSTSVPDLYFQKIDGSGNTTFIKQLGGNGHEAVYAVIIDAANNIYIQGDFELTVDFDFSSGTSNLTATGSQGFLQKLDANANLLWVKKYDANIVHTSIATDAANNTYITGSYTNTANFDLNSGTTNLTSAGNYDYFIQKLDANSNLLWAKSIGNNLFDFAFQILIDSQNNIYTQGTFDGTVDFDPNTGVDNLTSTNGSVFIHKLSQGSTGLVDNSNTNNFISVYPNPSSQSWNVEFINIKPNALELVDITGKVIWINDATINSAQTITIPNTQLATGVYTLKAVFANNVEVQKLIKQ